MRNLLACTALTPIILLAATGAQAETTISTKVAGPVRTATVNAGAADDLKIASTGSIVPTAAGAAVTLDSNNDVKNEGTITITDLDDSTGILATPGFAGSISNSGKIEVIETYAPSDADKDNDIDGAFASGMRRYGIRVAPGGTFTGTITNSGTITVEGNDSAGIAIDSRLAGSLAHSGSLTVVGDRTFGIRTGEVTGDVRITGSVGASGQDAVGVAVDGAIGGALVVQNAVNATGYRYTTVPTDSSKLDADDLLQGGAALRVSASVSKGILFDAPPPNNSATDNDEDKDGIEDSKEGISAIASYGAAPAVQIGSVTQAVTIGAATADAHAIVNNGGIAGRGLYSNVDGTAVRIGGLGGTVTVANGFTNNGQILATSNGASATAVRIGSGATVNEIRNTGTIQADAGGAATASGRGIVVESGATVTTVRNTGKIAVSATGNGTAAAVSDHSGKLALIENSGAISATGVGADTGRAIAIDLRANNAGAVVRQLTVGQGVAAPSVTGDILFGAGDDLLDLADGEVKGAMQFGAGANRLIMSGDAAYAGKLMFGSGADAINLAGTSVFTGTADFGGGADVLTLAGTSRFVGALANSGGLKVQVDGGTFDAAAGAPTQLAGLAVGAQGVLGVTLDPANAKSTMYQVSGTASFAPGSKIQVRLVSVAGSVGEFTVLKAGSLTGTTGLTTNSVALPVFLKSTVTANEAAGELAVTIGKKTAAEMGLNASETGIWDGMFGVLDKDAKVASAFLAMTDGEVFQDAVQAMLPDHAGGVFESVTQGSRATTRFLRDPGSPLADMGGWGFWLQQAGWGTAKDIGDTSSYDITGWGAAGGAEAKLGALGNVGLSLAYLNGRNEVDGIDNEVRADQYELAAYWRGRWGPLRGHARASAAMLKLDGTRTFSGKVGSEAVTRTSTANWDGQLYSLGGGASYELPMARLSLRPAVSLDYYRLSEDGYSETGGGAAMDLVVEDRTSDELAVEATLTAGYDLGSLTPEDGWLRVELEGGRRQIVGGALGDTIARYATGSSFTLSPEGRSDGWVGKLRLLGGNTDFSLGGEVGAEEQHGHAAIAFRASLQAAF